jgi:NAD(P)-dependent dehydrogenase (short-subunit alcohol dehydrogenase family)
MTPTLPDLSGKNAIVTGANTGIGRVTARELARAGARVWLGCRSPDKARPVLDEIAALGGRAELLALDLSELAKVRAAAQTFLDLGEPLHLIVNNAGLAGSRGLTKDGFELLFGVNHLGPFLFTELLLPALAAPARIVNVASRAHYRAGPIDWDSLRQPTRHLTSLPEYARSKLCNVLHARELAARLSGRGVTTYSLHPGGIASDIWRRIPWPFRPIALSFMKTVEEGAQTSLRCATAPELAGASGRYYDDDGTEVPPAPLALDDGLMAELRRRSAGWCGIEG